jgi:hypothetical protein
LREKVIIVASLSNTFFLPVISAPTFSAVFDVGGVTRDQRSDEDHKDFHELFSPVTEGIGYDRPHSLWTSPVIDHASGSDVVTGAIFAVIP